MSTISGVRKQLIRVDGIPLYVPPPSGFFYANNRNLVGPVPGSSLQQIGSIQTNTTLSPTANNQTFRNVEVWGSFDNKSFSGTRIENSILHGTLVRGTQEGFVISQNYNHRGLVCDHVRFEGRGDLGTDTNGTWGPVGRRLDNEWLSGMRGGNYTLDYCEMTSIIDALTFIGYNDGSGTYVGNVLVDHTWIHNGLFNIWTAAEDGVYYPSQKSYYTHADAIQISRGKGYTVRRSYIGGAKAYGTDRNSPNAIPIIQAADNYYNSGLLIKQEEASDIGRKIENVLVEESLFEGNLFNITQSFGNTYPTIIFRNNRFIRIPPQYFTLQGSFYMLVGPSLGAQIYGNVLDDDNSAAPVSRGA